LTGLTGRTYGPCNMHFHGHVPRWQIAARIRDGQMVARTLDGKPFDRRLLRSSPDDQGRIESERIANRTRADVHRLRLLMERQKALGLYCREREP